MDDPGIRDTTIFGNANLSKQNKWGSFCRCWRTLASIRTHLQNKEDVEQVIMWNSVRIHHARRLDGSSLLSVWNESPRSLPCRGLYLESVALFLISFCSPLLSDRFIFGRFFGLQLFIVVASVVSDLKHFLVFCLSPSPAFNLALSLNLEFFAYALRFKLTL